MDVDRHSGRSVFLSVLIGIVVFELAQALISAVSIGPAVTPTRLSQALSAFAFLACSNGQRLSADRPSNASATPSTEDATASVAQISAGAPSTARTTLQAAAGSTGIGASTNSASMPKPSADAASGKVEPVPPLRDESGKPLPQTEELPSFESPSFQRRLELLYQAIVKDEPALAAPAFFPLIAYEQVKAISQPARDHKVRLLAAFAKNIHDYHRQLGKDPTAAKLLRVSPSTLAPRWMKPGTEGNQLGYHRLLRSRLKIADARGTEHDFEITSMISWRGEWYVVHLNGFK
jgi:hypothetical protein